MNGHYPDPWPHSKTCRESGRWFYRQSLIFTDNLQMWNKIFLRDWLTFCRCSASDEICTLLCCYFVYFCVCVEVSYAVISCGFMWYIYPYSLGLLHWHWGNHIRALARALIWLPQCQWSNSKQYLSAAPGSHHRNTNINSSIWWGPFGPQG